jgi:hypothetical protein
MHCVCKPDGSYRPIDAMGKPFLLKIVTVTFVMDTSADSPGGTRNPLTVGRGAWPGGCNTTCK